MNIDVAGDEEIDFPVPIEIAERASSMPSRRVTESGNATYFGERAVPIVFEEEIATDAW